MKNTQKYAFKIESATHPGITGKQNEDRYGSTMFLAGEKRIPCLLSVLCDGIGGHHAGEKAAEMGVSIITEVITGSDPTDPLAAIQAAVTTASEAIFRTSLTDAKFSGMGSTCAVAWLIGDQLYTANLGDSRIYILRRGQIIQLTTDHTWVQEALDAGVINGDDYEGHPNAHVIRRYLGSKSPPEPDFRLWYFAGEQDSDAFQNQGMKIKPGDTLLLCSDGLTDLVADHEIFEAVQSNPLTQVPDMLIELANQRGGYDNTTVVLIQSQPKNELIKNSKKRQVAAGCFGGLILLITVIAAVVLVVCFLNGRLQQDSYPTPTPTMAIDPGLLEPSGDISPTLSPTTTSSSSNSTEFMPPQYTITPWPTHTPAP